MPVFHYSSFEASHKSAAKKVAPNAHLHTRKRSLCECDIDWETHFWQPAERPSPTSPPSPAGPTDNKLLLLSCFSTDFPLIRASAFHISYLVHTWGAFPQFCATVWVIFLGFDWDFFELLLRGTEHSTFRQSRRFSLFGDFTACERVAVKF